MLNYTERAPYGARFVLGTTRLRGRRARSAEVFDGAVIVDGEVVETPRDAACGTVAVAYGVVEQYARTVDQSTHVVAVSHEVVRLGEPDYCNSVKQSRECLDVERLRRREGEEHVAILHRIRAAHGKRIARQESIYRWVAGWNLAARQVLDPRLIPQELQQQAARGGTHRVDAVHIHHRVARGQRRRVVNQYERVVVRLNCILRDQNFGKTVRQQIAQRHAIGVLEIRGAQLSRHPRVVDARLHGARCGSGIAGGEDDRGGEQERNTHHLIDDTFPSCLRVTVNVRS